MDYTLFVLAGLISVAASASVAPPGLVTTVPEAANATNATCRDVDEGCWGRYDEDCFGIYESWARSHCAQRCGYCGEPPCEDDLNYCDRFESNTCTERNFRIWAQSNCRKHCNLCGKPTPPSGYTTSSGGISGGPGNQGGVGGTTDATGVTNGSIPSEGVPHDIPGTVARGKQTYVVIQGPKSDVDGMCRYQGQDYAEKSRWNDGCKYECNCLNAAKNVVVCSERCTLWNVDASRTQCKIVQEDNECCERLEC